MVQAVMFTVIISRFILAVANIPNVAVLPPEMFLIYGLAVAQENQWMVLWSDYWFPGVWSLGPNTEPYIFLEELEHWMGGCCHST